MPLFSIVIPTRNRAHLLRYALQSALSQTFDDYEIVISDNHSDDNTAQVVKKLSNSQVKYFKTDQVLSMTNNWEFALSKASGEWITFLCDDDAMCPRTLEKLGSIIANRPTSVIKWARDTYYHNNCYEPILRNKLIHHPFTNQIVDIDSRTQLAMLFERREDGNAPKMLNSCCHREVINKIVRQVGRFFLGLAPDYSASAAMLAVVDSYTYIDTPLMIGGIAKESSGGFARYARGEMPFALLEESQEYNLFGNVPLQLPVQTNIMVETLLKVKEAMPELLSDVNICWYRYFILCYEELMDLKSIHGMNISVMKKHFRSVLAQQSLNLRVLVGVYMLRTLFSHIIRTLLRPIINRHPTLFHLKLLIRKLLLQSKIKIVDGKIADFSNIFEAAQYLDRLVSLKER
ncbi:MAG: glycosyltransferase family A protein [Thermodesulfovibrionales bacterium]|nr:glycosyltransferase family A protein [Thermodesulfovibrionales bacterium]